MSFDKKMMNMSRENIIWMRWLCMLGFAMLLYGCAARPSGFTPGLGNKYVYTYKMSYPADSVI